MQCLQINLEKSTEIFGLVASLATTILAFSATTYDDEIFIPDDALELDEDFLVEPPRTAEPPPPPPPPPPPVIEEVPEEEIEEEATTATTRRRGDLQSSGANAAIPWL